MTDRERLEEIKQQLEESKSYDDNPNGYWYHNINWLIEQAERVQELEKQLEKSRNGLYNCNMCYERAEKQNKRYRETIEKIKDYNRKALKGNYTENEALLDISLEIRKLEESQ